MTAGQTTGQTITSPIAGPPRPRKPSMINGMSSKDYFAQQASTTGQANQFAKPAANPLAPITAKPGTMPAAKPYTPPTMAATVMPSPLAPSSPVAAGTTSNGRQMVRDTSKPLGSQLSLAGTNSVMAPKSTPAPAQPAFGEGASSNPLADALRAEGSKRGIDVTASTPAPARPAVASNTARPVTAAPAAPPVMMSPLGEGITRAKGAVDSTFGAMKTVAGAIPGAVADVGRTVRETSVNAASGALDAARKTPAAEGVLATETGKAAGAVGAQTGIGQTKKALDWLTTPRPTTLPPQQPLDAAKKKRMETQPLAQR